MHLDNSKVWVAVAFALVFFVLGAAFFVATGKGNPGKPEATVPKIEVDGYAYAVVSPDQATVYLYIETLDKNASKSQSMNAEIYDKVKEALLKYGVKEDKIKTTYYSVYLAKEWHKINGTYEEVPVGYKTVHDLTFSTTDTGNVGKILDSVVSAGASIDSVYFDLTDEKEKEIKDKLLSDAVKDAERKADIISSTAGLGKVRLVYVSYGTPKYNPIPLYESALSEASATESSSTSVSPGEVKVYVSIDASFEPV